VDGSKDLGAFLGTSVWQRSADNFSYSCWFTAVKKQRIFCCCVGFR